MKKIIGEPGIISKTLKKVPDTFFENAAMLVLLSLILILPSKMIYIFATNVWEYDYIYATIQSVVVYVGLVIGVLFFAKRIIMYGFGYVRNLLKSNRSFVFLACFLVWAYFASAFAESPKLAFFSNLHRNEGYITYVYYCIIFFTACLVSSNKKKRIVCNVFAITATILCTVTILQRHNTLARLMNLQDSVIYAERGEYASVFSYYNHYGYFLCMAILCCVGLIITDNKKKTTIFHSILLIINVWSLVVNDTFGSYIAAAIAMFVILMLYIIKAKMNKEKFNKWTLSRIILPVLIFVSVSVFASVDSNPLMSQFFHLSSDLQKIATDSEDAYAAGRGRWHMWKLTTGYIFERPTLGYGAEGLIDKFKADNMPQDRPANEYLQYAAFFGIPGLIFYFLTLCSIFFVNIKKLKVIRPLTLVIGGCVIAYAVSAFFGNTMYNTTIYFYMFLGLVSKEQPTDEIQSE